LTLKGPVRRRGRSRAQGRSAEIRDAPAMREDGMYDFRVSDPDGYVLAFGRAPD